MPIKTHKKLHQFRKQRSDAKDIQKIRLFEDVHDVKHLARHVDEFKKALKEDLKSENFVVLKKHIDEFEHEIHNEVSQMMGVTKKDLDHYLSTLHSLAELKKMMVEMKQKDPRFKRVIDTELEYAKIIHKGLHQKLSTMERMFGRMRQR